MSAGSPRMSASEQADHIIRLDYGERVPMPEPLTIRVRQGETILFEFESGPPNGVLQVTFENPEYFSAEGIYRTGDPAIVIESLPPNGTSYECVMLVDGVPEQDHNGQRCGGSIEQDTPI